MTVKVKFKWYKTEKVWDISGSSLDDIKTKCEEKRVKYHATEFTILCVEDDESEHDNKKFELSTTLPQRWLVLIHDTTGRDHQRYVTATTKEEAIIEAMIDLFSHWTITDFTVSAKILEDPNG